MKMRWNSLGKKLIVLMVISIVPISALNLFMLRFMTQFQASYDEIIGNMTIANSYNLNFKEELDETKQLIYGQAS